MSTRGLVTLLQAPGGAHRRLDDIATWMLRQAARNSPRDLGPRLREEWLAHMAERPAGILRLRFALGCLWAAMVISVEHAPGEGATAAAASGQLATAPAFGRMPHPVRGRALHLRRAPEPVCAVICEINTTPLIDVMLVLVVTLMISLPLMTHAVKLDLPGSTAAGDAPPPVIDIDVDFDGTVVWNGTPVAGFEQLDGYLSAQARRVPQPEIHLRPDRRARYDVVAKVLAAAQRNHLQRIDFANTVEFGP